MPRREKNFHHPVIVQNVAIHEDDVATTRKRLAHRPLRDDAAFLVVRVVYGLDPIGGAHCRQLGVDQIGAIAHRDDDLLDAEVAEDLDMPAQQRLAAKLQHDLGQTVPVEFQPPAGTGRKDNRSHPRTLNNRSHGRGAWSESRSIRPRHVP